MIEVWSAGADCTLHVVSAYHLSRLCFITHHNFLKLLVGLAIICGFHVDAAEVNNFCMRVKLHFFLIKKSMSLTNQCVVKPVQLF